MNTDLTRTLADIAAAPVPPVKRPDPPYDGWFETDIEGLGFSIPYWHTNARDADDHPDIWIGPPQDWKLLSLAASLRAVLEGEIAEKIVADDIAARVDRDCDRRDDGDWSYDASLDKREDR